MPPLDEKTVDILASYHLQARLMWGHENQETLLIGGKYWVWGFEGCVRLCLFLADSPGQVQFPRLHRVDKSISLADSLEG